MFMADILNDQISVSVLKVWYQSDSKLSNTHPLKIVLVWKYVIWGTVNGYVP